MHTVTPANLITPVALLRCYYGGTLLVLLYTVGRLTVLFVCLCVCVCVCVCVYLLAVA